MTNVFTHKKLLSLILFCTLLTFLLLYHKAITNQFHKESVLEKWENFKINHYLQENETVSSMDNFASPEYLQEDNGTFVKTVKNFPSKYPQQHQRFPSNEVSGQIQKNSINVWEALDEHNLILYKEAAYFDQRQPEDPKLRVLVYKNHGVQHQGSCLVKHFTHGSGSQWVAFPGEFDLINLGAPWCTGGCVWRYEAYFFICKMASSPQAIKVSLQVSNQSKISSEISQITPTFIPRSHSSFQGFLALCTKAVYDYGDWMGLALFIEIYNFLGVQKFILYNYSTTVDVDRMLNYYSMDRGLIEIVPWPAIPIPHPEPKYFKTFLNISDHGQILAHSDCILRCTGKFQYVVLVDTDELIGLENGTIYHNFLVDLLRRKSAENIGVFKVRSAYTKAPWPNMPGNFSAENLKIPNIFENLTRDRIERPNARTKMILRPETVEKLTVHFPWAYLPGFQGQVLDPKEAVIYHFRSQPYSWFAVDQVDVSPFLDIKTTISENVRFAVKEILKKNRNGK